MSIRIAIASSDGVNINQHFGRARTFRIYALQENNFIFEEERSVQPACSGQQHSSYGLQLTAAAISDCQAVVVSQIGAGAIDLLIGQRILPFALEGSIDAALATLQQSNRLKFLKE